MSSMIPARHHYNPDCRDGKHAACSATAWDDDNDFLTICSCECHNPPAVDPLDICSCGHSRVFHDEARNEMCHQPCCGCAAFVMSIPGKDLHFKA